MEQGNDYGGGKTEVSTTNSLDIYRILHASDHSLKRKLENEPCYLPLVLMVVPL